MKPVIINSIADLKVGDTLRGKATGAAYTVIHMETGKGYAVRMVTVTNPNEWELMVDEDEVGIPPVDLPFCPKCGCKQLEILGTAPDGIRMNVSRHCSGCGYNYEADF